MRFVSSGLACVDYIASLETYPEENTKNVSQGTLVTFGGNAANMACGLSMMGEAVQLATVLYADPNGAFIESELLKHGVALTPSVRVAGNAGMSYIATCEDTASRTIFHTPAPAFTAELLPETLQIDTDTDVLLLDGRLYLLARRVADLCLAKNPHLPVMLDCERHNREGLEVLLQVASIVFCPAEFLLKRFDTTSLTDALQRFGTEAHPRLQAVYVTLGERGCFVATLSESHGEEKSMDTLSEHETTHLGCYTVVKLPAAKLADGDVIVDTTGAGDAFQAGVAFCLARGFGYERAARVAAQVALKICLAKGTNNYPSASEISRYMDTV